MTAWLRRMVDETAQDQPGVAGSGGNVTRCYSAATARGRALTTEALPEVISSWIHL